MPGLLIWYLGVFKALVLNEMAFALYSTSHSWHQSQPVIIWLKYRTLSAHQLLYSLLILNASVSINHCHYDDKHICFFSKKAYIYFLNTKRIVLQCNTSLTVFYLRQITEFKFSVQKNPQSASGCV